MSPFRRENRACQQAPRQRSALGSETLPPPSIPRDGRGPVRLVFSRAAAASACRRQFRKILGARKGQFNGIWYCSCGGGTLCSSLSGVQDPCNLSRLPPGQTQTKASEQVGSATPPLGSASAASSRSLHTQPQPWLPTPSPQFKGEGPAQPS